MLTKVKRAVVKFNARVNAKMVAITATLVGLSVASVGAHAITAPAAGSLAYDVYDVGINQMLNGAPGFVGGTAGIVYSASKLSQNWVWACLGILGCSAVLNADSITTSLGMII